MLARAAAGLAAAAVVALLARRAGSLVPSGAVAATAVGAAAVTAGWSWGALLVAYFVSASLLSRLGAAAKAKRVDAIVEKSGARDARQVLANGGAFALLVAGGAIAGGAAGAVLGAAALGALAASAADTWATEIGTLAGGTPRALPGFRPVPAGTSGGVSTLGSLAMVAGAAFVALAARALGVGTFIVPVLAGGVAGALADSLLGGLCQERRWCDTCERATERGVHDCGTATRLAGGLEWMDNDVVNLLATLVGAAVSAILVIH